MVELNRKHNLSTIPSIDNDGNAYVIPLDIYKEGYQAYDISNWFKGRVDDNATPFAIRWYSHGRLLNILGKRPFIEGQVGDYTIDDSDPDNPQITMAEDAASVHVVGDVTDTQEGGIAIYRLISQAFPKSGIFYGKIGFMGAEDDGTLVNTGVDIVFKVLAGHMNMLGARKFYVSELEKAWLDLQEKIRQYDQQYKDQIKQQSDQFTKDTQEQADKFKQETEQALADLNTKIANEIKRAEDTLGDTQASIDDNIAALKKIAASVTALQAQLDANNLETKVDHKNDIQNLKADFDYKIGNIHHPTQAFDSLAQLQAKYPNGADGDFVTVDTGHIYIYSWLTNSWKDCGAYQSQGIADNQITSKNLVAKATPVSTVFSSEAKIDYASKKLIIDKYISLNSTSYSGQIPTGTYDLNIDSDGVFVAFNPETKTIVGYKSYAEIPDNQIYLGWILWSGQICNFVFPVNDGKIKSSSVSTVWSNPPKIDYSKKSLTIDGFVTINSKLFSGQIPTGTYDLNIDSDGVFVAFNPETKTIVGYKSYAEIPDNQIYLGWILWSGQICNFVFPVNDGKIKSSSVSTVWSNPPKIDYSKKSLTIDGFVTINSKLFSGQIPTGTYDLNIDSDGVFVAFNPETKTIVGYKSYAEIPDNQIYLGWVLWSSQNCNFVFPVAQDIVDTRIAPKAYNLTASYNLAPVVDYENKKLKIIDHQTIIFTNFDKYVIDYGDHGPDHDTVVSFVSFNAENKKLNFYDDFYALPESEYYLGWIDWADRISNLVFSAGTKITKQWAGKKVTCLGDSITNGDSTGTGVDVPSWVERMARFIGTNPTKNALDGARVTKDLIRMSQSIKDQDLITIFAGINDFQNSDPLGSMSDSSENTTTFYGCLKYLVLHLSEQNPVAKFLFITPMKTTKFKYHTFDENGNLMKNADGHTQLDYVNAIKQVADYYSIPVLDMYTASNYSPYIPTQVGQDSFTLDGLHPTVKGYERLSRTIANAINNI